MNCDKKGILGLILGGVALCVSLYALSQSSSAKSSVKRLKRSLDDDDEYEFFDLNEDNDYVDNLPPIPENLNFD